MFQSLDLLYSSPRIHFWSYLIVSASQPRSLELSHRADSAICLHRFCMSIGLAVRRMSPVGLIRDFNSSIRRRLSTFGDEVISHCRNQCRLSDSLNERMLRTSRAHLVGVYPFGTLLYLITIIHLSMHTALDRTMSRVCSLFRPS